MKRLTVVLATALALASPLQAQVLTFEGIGNQVPIGNYYNGGAGPNYGIEFFGSALASESGVGNCQGTGNFTGQPSGCGVLFFPTAPSTGMNRAAGFTGGFSFFYFTSQPGGSFSVYDGLDGTGTLLASLNLPVTRTESGFDTCGVFYCEMLTAGISFSGTAQSVVFSGVANRIAFDNVTFGNAIPGTSVPEPSTWLLMASGLAAIGLKTRRRGAAPKA